MTHLKTKMTLCMALLTSIFAPRLQAQGDKQADKPALSSFGVYYNLHRQEGALGAGIFTGPVLSFDGGKPSFEFNAYAGLNVTGPKSLLRLRIGAVAGLGVSEGGVFEYAAPTLRLAPVVQNEKLKLLNNFCAVATLSIKKPPTVFVGYAWPIGAKDKKSTAVLFDMQRYP